ncbi:MAG: thrombospondin type 3 repeat-containing protein [Phycisphaerales bacterium]|nr:thrombospondin type 3 repeat-containing protein [Phycisphaerales bacterium]
MRMEKKMMGRNSCERIRRQQITLVAVALALGSAVSTVRAQNQFNAIYWGDTVQDTIFRSDPDGANAMPLITGIPSSSDFVIDGAGGKIYWTDTSVDAVRRANLDGSGAEDLITGLSNPIGIALDVAAGKLYWANTSGNDSIHRANMEIPLGETPSTRTDIEILITGVGSAWGLALDLDSLPQKIYWADNVNDVIRRADLADGANQEDLVLGETAPRAFRLDVAAGKMYWTDTTDDVIRRAGMEIPVGENASNRTDIEDLVTSLPAPIGVALSSPFGMSLDLVNDKIYFADTTLDVIACSNLDGSSVEIVLTPEALALATGDPGANLVPRSIRFLPCAVNDCDLDGDLDGMDNCPFIQNADQLDGDTDMVGDVCDNCPADTNMDQIDTDGDGLGDACDPCPLDVENDADSDGICEVDDVCPTTPDPLQADTDSDGLGDACDNCPVDPNPDQADCDMNGTGDVCETDTDTDGIPDACDNCPFVTNLFQTDTDGDGVGDACDTCTDSDGDGFGDPDAPPVSTCAVDNCPDLFNNTQADVDLDGVGDNCDNCPFDSNPDQQNLDGDSQGDVCDTDIDDDGFANGVDNCPMVLNQDQADVDGDLIGDLCDPDADGDGIVNENDNCPFVSNVSQDDVDNDGVGDACDPCVPSTTADKLYWTSFSGTVGPSIRRTDLDDGTCKETLLATATQAYGLAVDADAGKVYWSSFLTDTIHRANLDGGSVETLVTNAQDPRGIALDLVNSKLYWVQDGDNSIHRANLDGSDNERIRKTDGEQAISEPRGIAVDPVGGKIYWSDEDVNIQSIMRANLDGTHAEVIAGDLAGNGDLSEVQHVALDVAGGKVYWVDDFVGALQRANMDGTGAVETVINAAQPPMSRPVGLVIDENAGRLYWSEPFDNIIASANLDGSGVSTLVSGEFQMINALALPTVAPVIGDCDGNGTLEFGDVSCFVDALLGVDTIPAGGIARSDVNNDGATDGLDIQTFVQLLLP